MRDFLHSPAGMRLHPHNMWMLPLRSSVRLRKHGLYFRHLVYRWCNHQARRWRITQSDCFLCAGQSLPATSANCPRRCLANRHSPQMVQSVKSWVDEALMRHPGTFTPESPMANTGGFACMYDREAINSDLRPWSPTIVNNQSFWCKHFDWPCNLSPVKCSHCIREGPGWWYRYKWSYTVTPCNSYTWPY